MAHHKNGDSLMAYHKAMHGTNIFIVYTNHLPDDINSSLNIFDDDSKMAAKIQH